MLVNNEANPVPLPDDSEALKAMLRTLMRERDEEKRRADQETQRSDKLRVEMLRLQLELERYRKWYYVRVSGVEAANMRKKNRKPPSRKIVLRLRDLDHTKAAVLNSLSSPHSRRN